MKNNINYYYSLSVKVIHQKNNNYYFSVDNNNYILLKWESVNNLENIYKLNDYLIKILPIHKIILNKENKIVTKINNNNYILLQLYENKIISINDIIEINNVNLLLDFSSLKLDDWYLLWSNKIDYFEYQISQIGKKYSIIRESFNYYVGLAENAIILANEVDRKNVPLGLCHRRISNYSFDLYNPLNMIVDVRIRDVCEYFKYCFFNNIDIEKELEMFLNYNRLDMNESKLFLARMLFPTYYFDIYEKIINSEIKEEEIKKIINKIDSYERILKKVYYHFKNNQIYIEWLENIN